MEFWLNNPNVLIQRKDFIPTGQMSMVERLNAVTRALIVVCAIMAAMGYPYALAILLIGLVLVIIIYARGCAQPRGRIEGFKPRRGVHDPCRTCGGDSTMAYINSKYETTPLNQYQHTNDGLRSYTHAHYKVIPLDTPAPYREVWRNEPRFCNEFSATPESYTIPPACAADYEYINLPTARCTHEDERWVDNTGTGVCPPRGKRSAVCNATQPAFMRDSSEFRNNIMGEYVDYFGRQRNHLCTNFKPGRKTW